MTQPEFSSLAEQRLRKLQELQELRRQRDAVVAHDPGGARRALVEEHPTPLDFAERFDMRTKRTPALELISRKMRETVDTRDGRLVVSMPPQEGKSIDCGVDILTPQGWKRMGDLVVGDEVFHPDGHPTRVVEAHPWRYDRPCYRVTTIDGRELVVDGEHLWTVQDRRVEVSKGPTGNRVRTKPWVTLTTQQLLNRGLSRTPYRRGNGKVVHAPAYRLPDQQMIVSKPVDLPVDPWLLGAWLGDGTRKTPNLTVGDAELPEMRQLIENTGAQIISVRPDRKNWCVRVATPNGFRVQLCGLGVWDDKHIPEQYLTAGTEQRLALLQGLLDTDGSIYSNKSSMRVEFTSTRRVLADGVRQLARSLGWRATVREGVAKLDGREISTYYRVCFTPTTDQLCPFRLARKAARVQAPQSRGTEASALSIASIEPVETRPVRCIKVEREDGLFLAGRDLVPTHNTTTLRWLIVWLLCDNPDRRIVSISFAQSLARQTGREVRNHLRSHPELCLPLDRSHQDATDWGIEGRAGGLYSVGIGGALTGRPADVLIVDDPLKGREQADSDTVRDAMHDWWSSVARTRPAPGSPMIITQTRWHEDDLAGRMVESGWPYVNIPALADGQTEDALERPAGEWLISARGRSRADWEMVRADVGERDFAALYQGRPAPLEGGIFQHAWFDAHRISEDHRPHFVLSVVGVDPADTGKGDAAGILVAGLTRDGKIVFTDDLSAQLTQAQWARKACLAWIRHGATRIVQEHNLGMRTSIPDAWALLFRQAKALADVDEATLLNGDDGRPPLAFDELTARGDSQAADLPGLRNILSVFRLIVDAGGSGPRVVSITPKQSKRVRAESVAGAFETGRACMLGRLPKLEFECATWQEGQRSPNRIDVLAMLTTHLEAARGHARVSKVSDVGGAVIPINTAKSRSSVAGRPGVTPMEMRRAMRHNAQSPHEKDA